MDLRVLIVFIISVWLIGCSKVTSTDGPGKAREARAPGFLVLSSDYRRTAVLEAFGPKSTAPLWRVPVFGDSVLRTFDGFPGAWVINRMEADNVQYVSSLGKTLYQYSVGRGNNPQDILPVSDEEAWVSLFDDSSILQFEIKTGRVLGRIDLKAYADEDGMPEATKMALVDSSAWIQLQALDRAQAFGPSGKSGFLVMDPKQASVLSHNLLKFQNPLTDWKLNSQMAYVGAAGTVTGGVLDGGIERWSRNPVRFDGEVLSEKEMGGKLVDFALLSDQLAVAIASENRHCWILVLQLDDGKILKQFPTNFEDDLMGVVSAPQLERFYLLDRSVNAPAIRSFSTITFEEIENEKLDLKLPPAGLAILP